MLENSVNNIMKSNYIMTKHCSRNTQIIKI